MALTDEDRAGRDQFVAWVQELGCTVHVDQMGNLFARREGTAAPVEVVSWTNEEGPILEAVGVTLGAVTGVQGIRWYDVSIKGQAMHDELLAYADGPAFGLQEASASSRHFRMARAACSIAVQAGWSAISPCQPIC